MSSQITWVGMGVQIVRLMVSKWKILSLFDYSGAWPKYFREDGRFQVIQVDIKHGVDILTWNPPKHNVYGILAAPPCTDFSVSGAQYWRQKDLDGRTEHSVALVMRAMEIIHITKPKFWVLENPVGRLNKWLGAPSVYVHPYEFAGYAPNPDEERYTKKTGLWGEFDLPPKRPLEPIKVCAQGSWVQRLGGKSERTKDLRSRTPLGLAKATYIGNAKVHK
jgi:hypothetical protein